MTTLLQHLIAAEQRAESDPKKRHLVAFQICEKLRQPLCAFTGVAGFRALFSRALTLAKAQAPLLVGIQIKPDGSLLFPAELEAQLHTEEAAEAGAALADHLLGLLITFIGEPLTLRLVHDVWPTVPTQVSKFKGKHP